MNNLKRKNFVWNLLGTSLNAFTSLFYMVIVTRTNGLVDAGIFTLAFSVACLLCNIGGYQGRVFQVTDTKKEFSNKEYILHRFITSVLMMIIALGYSVFMGYSGVKLVVTLSLCAVKCMEVAADVFYGILQQNGYLYKVGVSLSAKSIVSIFGFFIINFYYKNLMLACIFIFFVWVFGLVFYDIINAKKFIKSNERLNKSNVLKIFKAGFFTFAVIFLSVYVVNSPKYALDGRVGESLQAVYGIIIMPGTVISLCAQYLMHPFLPDISNKYIEKNRLGLKKIILNLLICVILIGFVSIALAYFFGPPVLSMIYSVDLSNYKLDLIIVLIGAICSALCMILSAALTTMRKTFVQFVIYVIISLVGFLLSPILINIYSIFGASLSYMTIMLIEFILYFFVYESTVSKFNWRKITND